MREKSRENDMMLEGGCQRYINSFCVMLWADPDFNICFFLECHNEMGREGPYSETKANFHNYIDFCAYSNLLKFSELLNALTLLPVCS